MASYLRSGQAIPLPVIELLEAAAEIGTDEIVDALDEGALGKMISDLDCLSLLLTLEIVQELVALHERAGRFQEAAAMDLVADRLRDER